MAIKKNSGPKSKPLTQDQIAEGDSQMVARHVVQLEEFGAFDTVQIICTKRDAEGITHWFGYGSGNDFARAKSIEMWLKEFYEIHG